MGVGREEGGGVLLAWYVCNSLHSEESQEACSSTDSKVTGVGSVSVGW